MGYDLSGSASSSASAGSTIGPLQFGNVSFNPVAKSQTYTVWIVAGIALLALVFFLKNK